MTTAQWARFERAQDSLVLRTMPNTTVTEYLLPDVDQTLLLLRLEREAILRRAAKAVR